MKKSHIVQRLSTTMQQALGQLGVEETRAIIAHELEHHRLMAEWIEWAKAHPSTPPPFMRRRNLFRRTATLDIRVTTDTDQPKGA